MTYRPGVALPTPTMKVDSQTRQPLPPLRDKVSNSTTPIVPFRSESGVVINCISAIPVADDAIPLCHRPFAQSARSNHFLSTLDTRGSATK